MPKRVNRRVRTTTHQSWSRTSMAGAIMEIIRNGMSQNKAAIAFGVPATTLKRRLKMFLDNPDLEAATAKGMGSFHAVFNPVQEKKLVEYLIRQEEILHGLTSKEVRILAWQMAERNGIHHPFSEGLAGKEWLRCFLKRNSTLSYRKPEPFSTNRARCFNRIVVGNFYDLLLEQQTIKDVSGVNGGSARFPPHRIYNVDETVVSINPKTHGKILRKKEKRLVGKLQASDEGKHLTVTACISASGERLPLFFIFPRKKMIPNLLHGSPQGTWGLAGDSGWMNIEIFISWFEWFVDSVNPTEEEPVLLLLDGHSSWAKNMTVINYALKNHIVLLCFPSHCTHRLQPLDVSVMGPLSACYSSNIGKWMRENPGGVLAEADIASMLCLAFDQAATESTIRNGFRETGIHPFNREVFSDADYAPAEVTDQHQPSGTLLEENGETIQRILSGSFSGLSMEESCDINALETLISESRQLPGPVCLPLQSDSDINNDNFMQPSEGRPLSPFHALSGSDSETDFMADQSKKRPNTRPRIQSSPSDKDSEKLGNAKQLAGCSRRTMQNHRSQSTFFRPHYNVGSSDDENENESQTQDSPIRVPSRVSRRRIMTSSSDDDSDNRDIPASRSAEVPRRKLPPTMTLMQKACWKRQKFDIKPEIVAKLTGVNSSQLRRGNAVVLTSRLYIRELRESQNKRKEKKTEEDAKCIFCHALFSKSPEGQTWIQCDVCKQWAHVFCTQVCENDIDEDYMYECKECLERWD